RQLPSCARCLQTTGVRPFMKAARQHTFLPAIDECEPRLLLTAAAPHAHAAGAAAAARLAAWRQFVESVELRRLHAPTSHAHAPAHPVKHPGRRSLPPGWVVVVTLSPPASKPTATPPASKTPTSSTPPSNSSTPTTPVSKPTVNVPPVPGVMSATEQ